jgi:uncharacterized membrane protein YeaQ/YmgE (transglycosylase-associated protein family)
MVTSIIGWIDFGLIVGLIARLLVPGEQPMGFLMTVLLGIAGSLVGGFIGYAISGDYYSPAGWLLSILGAVLVLAGYQYMTGRRTTTP